MKKKDFIIAKMDDDGVKYLVSYTKDTATWSRNVLDAALSTHPNIDDADIYAARFGGYALLAPLERIKKWHTCEKARIRGGES